MSRTHFDQIKNAVSKLSKKAPVDLSIWIPKLVGLSIWDKLSEKQNIFELEEHNVDEETGILLVSGNLTLPKLGTCDLILEVKLNTIWDEDVPLDEEETIHITLRTNNPITLGSFFSIENDRISNLGIDNAILSLGLKEDEEKLTISGEAKTLGMGNTTVVIANKFESYSVDWTNAEITDYLKLPLVQLQRPSKHFAKNSDGFFEGYFQCYVKLGQQEIGLRLDYPAEEAKCELKKITKNPIPLPSLSDLCTVLGIATLSEILPQNVVDVTSGYLVEDFKIRLNLLEPELKGLDIKLTSTNTIDISDRLSIGGVGAEIKLRQENDQFTIGLDVVGKWKVISANQEILLPLRIKKSNDSSSWETVLDSDTPVQFQGLETLFYVFYAEEILNTIPKRLNTKFPFSLNQFQLKLDTSTKTLSTFTLGISSFDRWEIISDWIELEKPDVLFDVSKNEDKIELKGHASAKFDLFETSFEGKVLFDDWSLSSNLSKGSELNIQSISQKCFGTNVELPVVLKDLAFNEASINTSLSERNVIIKATTANPVELIPGYITVQKLVIDLEAQSLNSPDKRSLEGIIQGEIKIIEGASLTVKSNFSNPFKFEGILQNLSFRELFEKFVPGIRIPKELSNLNLKELFFSITPKTGEFSMKTNLYADAQFTLGEAQLKVDNLEFELSRNAEHKMYCKVKLSSEGAFTENLKLKKLNSTFEFKEDEKWTLSGSGDIDVFGLESHVSLQLLLETNESEEISDYFALNCTSENLKLTVDEVGNVDLESLQIKIKRTKESKQWMFKSTANLAFTPGGVEGLSIKNGTLTKPLNEEAIIFSGQIETPKIPYPIGAKEGELLPELEFNEFYTTINAKSLKISRSNGKWEFNGETEIQLNGLPDLFYNILGEAKFTASCGIGEKGAFIKASNFSQQLVIDDFITKAIHGLEILDLPPLGKSIVKLDSIELSLQKKSEVIATFAIGLPSKLNEFFGLHELEILNKKGFRVFETYNEEGENKDNLFKASIYFSDDGIGGRIDKLPFSLKDLTEGLLGDAEGLKEVDGGWVSIDLTPKTDIGTDKDLGKFFFRKPDLAFDFQKGSFRAAGGFKIDPVRGCSLPLKPLKQLLKIVQLDYLSEQIPHKVPLKSLKLLGEGAAPDALITYAQQVGIPIPDELKEINKFINEQFDKLPDVWKEYAEICIPEAFEFDINITPDQGFNISLEVKNGELRLLIPCQPPMLQGLRLRKFALGTAFGGSMLRMELDVHMDQTDYLTLLSCFLPIWADSNINKYLPDRSELKNSMEIRDLFMLIVIATEIPIPIPIFYDIHMRAVELHGGENEFRMAFKKPQLEVLEILKFLTELKPFFTSRDLLNTEHVKGLFNRIVEEQSPNTFRIGPSYTRLPKILGYDEVTIKDNNGTDITTTKGKLLGIEAGYETLKPYDIARIFLNTFKLLTGLGPDDKDAFSYLLQLTPLEHRVGQFSLNLLDQFKLKSDWLLTTIEEYQDTDNELIQGKPIVQTLKKDNGQSLINLLDIQSPLENEGKGVLLFMASQLEIANSILKTGFGLQFQSAKGLRIAMAAQGNIMNSMQVAMGGFMNTDPNADEQFKGTLSTQLSAFGDYQIFKSGANVSLSKDQFIVDGVMSLFYDNGPTENFAFFGKVDGEITNSSIFYEGDISFYLFRKELTNSHIKLEANNDNLKVSLDTTILGKNAKLKGYTEDHNNAKRLVLNGEVDRIDYPGLVSFVGNESNHPQANLVIASDGVVHAAYLDAKIVLLGMIGSGITVQFHEDEWRFKFDQNFKIANFFSSTLSVDALVRPGLFVNTNINYDAVLKLAIPEVSLKIFSWKIILVPSFNLGNGMVNSLLGVKIFKPNHQDTSDLLSRLRVEYEKIGQLKNQTESVLNQTKDELSDYKNNLPNNFEHFKNETIKAYNENGGKKVDGIHVELEHLHKWHIDDSINMLGEITEYAMEGLAHTEGAESFLKYCYELGFAHPQERDQIQKRMRDFLDTLINDAKDMYDWANSDKIDGSVTDKYDYKYRRFKARVLPKGIYVIKDGGYKLRMADDAKKDWVGLEFSNVSGQDETVFYFEKKGEKYQKMRYKDQKARKWFHIEKNGTSNANACLYDFQKRTKQMGNNMMYFRDGDKYRIQAWMGQFGLVRKSNDSVTPVYFKEGHTGDKFEFFKKVDVSKSKFKQQYDPYMSQLLQLKEKYIDSMPMEPYGLYNLEEVRSFRRMDSEYFKYFFLEKKVVSLERKLLEQKQAYNFAKLRYESLQNAVVNQKTNIEITASATFMMPFGDHIFNIELPDVNIHYEFSNNLNMKQILDEVRDQTVQNVLNNSKALFGHLVKYGLGRKTTMSSSSVSETERRSVPKPAPSQAEPLLQETYFDANAPLGKDDHVEDLGALF